MNYEKILNKLIEHEGIKLHPYLCTAGKTSIGVGRNLIDKGITKEEAVFLVKNDIDECIEDLRGIFKTFDQLPENIQMVLIDMRFQLGISGFRKFKRLIGAVNNHDWKEMIVQMKDSSWYNQVPNRADDLISLVSYENNTCK